ncbi:hypothetical protein [Okeania sp. KiyG1]|uniref:hypothetical protein n=1 Tax=Okeania sp. KiyG1 TaxID=2720165 RepID=UPI001922F583|nr:hypothetical protein [Okeania sp. KiyG1]
MSSDPAAFIHLKSWVAWKPVVGANGRLPLQATGRKTTRLPQPPVPFRSRE